MSSNGNDPDLTPLIAPDLVALGGPHHAQA